MSNYDWEQGTIKIPKKTWPSFRSAILKEWNLVQKDLLKCLLDAYKVVKSAGKSKEVKLRKQQHEMALWIFCGGDEYSFDARSYCEKYDFFESILFPAEGRGTLVRPSINSVNIVSVSKSARIEITDSVSVTFNNDSCELKWSVQENNHAVRDAHRHPMAVTIFRELNRINWTKGSGGQIIGNDEYNDDGCNYVNWRFGPLGEDRK